MGAHCSATIRCTLTPPLSTRCSHVSVASVPTPVLVAWHWTRPGPAVATLAARRRIEGGEPRGEGEPSSSKALLLGAPPGVAPLLLLLRVSRRTSAPMRYSDESGRSRRLQRGPLPRLISRSATVPDLPRRAMCSCSRHTSASPGQGSSAPGGSSPAGAPPLPALAPPRPELLLPACPVPGVERNGEMGERGKVGERKRG
jgi:hypothetical protein